MNKNPIKPLLSGQGTVVQLFAGLALVSFFAAGVAMAAPPESKGPIVATLTLKKVEVNAISGIETLVDAPKTKPGDLLEYSTVYRNRSSTAVQDLNASLPIPFGLEYVKNSAKPATGVLATIDNKKFEPIPLKRTVSGKNGKPSVIDVPLAEYRGLRWVVAKLDGGQKVEVSARMRVVEVAKTPEELVKKPGKSTFPFNVQPSVKPAR